MHFNLTRAHNCILMQNKWRKETSRIPKVNHPTHPRQGHFAEVEKEPYTTTSGFDTHPSPVLEQAGRTQADAQLGPWLQAPSLARHTLEQGSPTLATLRPGDFHAQASMGMEVRKS
uniref:Uncharacterized protein n=1 Tax=Micrurus corallinus TaxID=54390 RepID=A0A2D4FUF6_MICCO